MRTAHSSELERANTYALGIPRQGSANREEADPLFREDIKAGKEVETKKFERARNSSGTIGDVCMFPSVMIPGLRNTAKRDSRSVEYDSGYGKMVRVRNNQIDALLQTHIPEIPEMCRTNGFSVFTYEQCSIPPLPSLDFFANDIMYFNNGTLERTEIPIVNGFPVPLHAPQNSVSLLALFESDDDMEYSVYSSDESSEKGLCSTLKDYCCPICLSSPSVPVSTTCGHVFCKHCLQRLFRLPCDKWACPSCRELITPGEYHPIYLP